MSFTDEQKEEIIRIMENYKNGLEQNRRAFNRSLIRTDKNHVDNDSVYRVKLIGQYTKAINIPAKYVRSLNINENTQASFKVVGNQLLIIVG